MEMFTTMLAYGYLIIVGFIFLVMIIQIVAFYIAGRVTQSINDEITSAFTLLGAGLFIGIMSTLINAGISIFLSGMLIPGVVSFVIYLAAIIYAVVKIYELSIGKTILHLLLSFVITALLLGGSVYALTFTSMLDGKKANELALKMDKLKEDQLREIEKEMEEAGNEEIGAGQPVSSTQPSLPAQPVQEAGSIGSHDPCSASTPCVAANEVCLADICQTKQEIESQFITNVSNCAELACENCENQQHYNLVINFTNGDVISFCAECDEGMTQNHPCKEGFSCLGYKCVAE